MRSKEFMQLDRAIHLTKLGKFHRGQDTLAQYVPQRSTHLFALHPVKWQSTFFSLTNKDPRKLKYYGPKMIDIIPGTLIADMYLANQFYRTDDLKEKDYFAKEYIKSIRLYPGNLDDYKMPELLIPKQ